MFIFLLLVLVNIGVMIFLSLKGCRANKKTKAIEK